MSTVQFLPDEHPTRENFNAKFSQLENLISTSGVHIETDAPADPNANFWVDIDDISAPIKYKNPNTGEWEAIEISTGSEPGLRMDLLWENASPTSEFAAQTIELNLSGAAFAVIISRIVDESGIHVVDVIQANIGSKSIITYGNDVTYVFSRNYSISENGDIKVSDCAQNATATTQNKRLVPYQIYGIKGVTSNV